MLYLQGLVYLKGKRPQYLTHGIVGSTSKLLAQAGREYPLRVYAATPAGYGPTTGPIGLAGYPPAPQYGGYPPSAPYPPVTGPFPTAAIFAGIP